MFTDADPPVPDPATPDPVPRLVWAQLATIVLGAQPLTPTLQRIAAIALQVIPELVDVSITLIEHGRPRTVGFTGPLAMELDERQYTDGYGPCTDAAMTGATIIVDTTSSHSSYPGFARAAARRGITSTLSVGLPIPQPTAGALNMYSAADQPISADSIAAAEEFTGYAAVAVTNAALYHAAAHTALHMSTALRSRAVIEQAKGIIMGREHCTADEAFRVLARTSQHRNQKLRDIAAATVAHTLAARAASRPSGPDAPESNPETGTEPSPSGPGPEDDDADRDLAPKPVGGQTDVHSSSTHERSGPLLPTPATSPPPPSTFEADARRRADGRASVMTPVEERDRHPAPAPPDPAVAAYAEQIASLTQHVEQLEAALESNRTVGAAIGIVMERLQLDRAAAFMYLVRRSQHANQKLSSIAEDLIVKVERNASTS